MKGYYEFNIRRAGTKALRKLSFHNHLKPGLYDIIFAKTVSDSANSVVDTLVLGNGVGEHADTAKTLNGAVVFSKRYSSYTPPSLASLASVDSDLLHTFVFGGFIEAPIDVGEVAIGAYINDAFVAASLIHIQDTEGNPTRITLLPGDEVSITWVLKFTRPFAVARTGLESESKDLFFNKSSFEFYAELEYDYAAVTAYRNWNLMGFKRILEITNANNKLLTKSDWGFRYQHQLDWVDIAPDDLSTYEYMLREELYYMPDRTNPEYVGSGIFYLPYILMPLKLVNYSNYSKTNTTPILGGVGIKTVLEDAYAGWLEQFRIGEYREKPSMIDTIRVTLEHNAYASDDQDTMVVHTVPFVYVNAYRDGKRIHSGLANEHGTCRFLLDAVVDRTTPIDYVVIAHTNRDSKSVSFTRNFVGDHTEMIMFAGLVTVGDVTKLKFISKRSRIGRRYRVTLDYTCVPDPVTNEPRTLPSELFNGIGGSISTLDILGRYIVGDKLKFNVLDNSSNILHQTFEYTVESLERVGFIRLGTWTDPHVDYCTVGIKKVV